MTRSPASASENRAHSAEKIGPRRYSDFFDRIGARAELAGAFPRPRSNVDAGPKQRRRAYRRIRDPNPPDKWKMVGARQLDVASARNVGGEITPARDINPGSEGLSRHPRRLFFRGVPQHVAATPHGFDVVFSARGVGQLSSQLAHEHVDDF